jgi:TIR domain
MAPEGTFNFDLFISYSRADGPWAEKLYTGLRLKGLEPFVDRKRLQPGAKWEQELTEGLSASQHIVVLWSGSAKQSEWVTRELGYFDAAINTPIPGDVTPNRKIIPLLLEEEPRAWNSHQMITDLREAGAYAASTDEVNPNLWQDVVDKVYDAVVDKDTRRRVPLAILTMTDEQVAKLNLNHQPWPAQQTLREFLKSVHIASKKQLRIYYGPRRTDWRPFNTEWKILPLLSRRRDEINDALLEQGLKEAQFRWDPIDEEKFWSDELNQFKEEVKKLKAGSFSVVVIDPIALYDDRAKRRLDWVSDELTNARVLFITPMPWRCSSAHRNVRDLIEHLAKPVYTRLYEPAFQQSTTPPFWHCDMNIGDEDEIKRALLPPLGQHLIGKRVPEVMRT